MKQEISNIYKVGQERLKNVNNKVKILKQDINSTRVYYTFMQEIMGRMFIIFSQILIIGALFFSIMSIKEKITELKWNNPSFKIAIILTIFVVTVIIATGMLLFFVIPLIICKTIGSLKNWSLTFIFVGVVLFNIVLGFNVTYMVLWQVQSYNKLAMGFIVGAYLFFVTGIGLLLHKLRKLYKEIEVTIISSYFLDEEL